MMLDTALRDPGRRGTHGTHLGGGMPPFESTGTPD